MSTQLKCPGCQQLVNVKTLAFAAGAAANGVTPQDATCSRCAATNPVATWIGNTNGCMLAPNTFFFGGAPCS